MSAASSRRPMFEKVAIVGVGLIGGSIGMAIRKRRLAKLVMGVVRQRATVAKAFRRRALQGATMSLKEGLRDADLVILCAPVSVILDQIRLIKPYLSPNAIVIDVASSKMLIDRAARKHLKGVRFVGCHPMAGSAKTGVMHASADLFRGAACFLTNADAKVEAFWQALGCHTHYLTPDRHDEWVARVSHLPHILSFALFQSGGAGKLASMGIEASNPSIQELARLSKSDPKLWADILLSNKEEILSVLADYAKSLVRLKSVLTSHDARAIERFISDANANSHKIVPRVS